MVFISMILLHLSAQAQMSCKSIHSTEEWDDLTVHVSNMTILDQQVEVRRVDKSQLINGKAVLGESLGGDEAFFIGLNTAGHMYMVANVYRFDGKFAFEKPDLKTRSSLLDRGLVVRIEDKDGNIQDQIIDYLKRNGPPRAIDCAAGVCKILSRAADIKLANSIRQSMLPKELIQKLITQGVHGADGKPKKVQVFILGNMSPEMIFQASDKAAKNYVHAALNSYRLLPKFLRLFLK